MPKRIEYGGIIHEFPDDITDAEIAAALGGEQPLAEPAGTTTTPTEREGAISRFAGGVGRSLNPLPLAEMLVRGALEPSSVLGGVVSAQREQLQKGYEAPAYSGEKILRILAGAVPLAGPAAAGMAEQALGGDVAGVAGELAGAAIPVGGVAGKIGGRLGKALKGRAAERMTSILEPGLKEGELVGVRKMLKERPGMITQIGTGDMESLVARTKSIKKRLGREEEKLRSISEPVSLEPVAEALERKATKYETTTLVPKEVGTGIFDVGGREITRTVDVPVTTSQFPEFGRAVRGRKKGVEALEEQFGGEVPGGEAIKQRGAAGQAGAAAENLLAGQKKGVKPTAAKITRQEMSKYLHDELKGVANVKAIDDLYSRWTTIADAMSRAEAKAVRSGFRDETVGYLKGRFGAKLMGAMFGAAAGGPLGAGGAAGAIGGAMIGHALSKNTFWNSLRATTYAKLAAAARSGNVPEAANLLKNAVVAYNLGLSTEQPVKNPFGKVKVGGELGKLQEEEQQ